MTGVKGQGGFSLIDVAVVMAIVGILLAGFLATYKMYQATRATTITEENFMASQEALGAFIPFKGNRYPRPAPFGLRDARPGEPGYVAGYGEEAKDADIVPCANATAAVGKVCRGVGANGQNVLIGVLPFADLNMSDTQARDGFGRLFTYAVTEALTVTDGVDPVDLVNNTTNMAPPDGIPDRDTDGDLIYRHYVCVQMQDLLDDGTITDPPVDCTKAAGNPPRPMALISHGADGIGGWLPSGQVYGACGALNAARQNENCNFDGKFIQAMRFTRNDNGTPGTDPEDIIDDFDMRVPLLIRGEGPNKNDDIIQVEVREDGNYWGAAGEDKVSNKYNYKIGIGVPKPSKPLEVKGNILATQSVLSKNLCSDSSTCLETEALSGDQQKMDCGQMGMVREIKNNMVDCVYVAQKNTSCATNEYIEGFNADGSAKCKALPPTCGSAHGTYLENPPSAAARCTSGTDTNFTGTGPWSWKCSDGASTTVSCSTVGSTQPPETTGCIDECGEQKSVGSTWCNRGSPAGRMRCAADGQSPSYEGCISGLGCCASGTLYCP